MKTLLTFSLVLIFAGLHAQIKTAYINKQAIFNLLPENEIAKKELARYQQKGEDELKAMKEKYEQERIKLEKEKNDLKPEVVNSRETDLKEMKYRIEQYESSSKDNLKKKESLLHEAIYKKIDDATKSVARKNGYAEIVDISSEKPKGYSAENDITQKVQTKLGI